ncbi:MAG: serine/threonine-protein kinase [Pseudomonadota bacterium]
MTKPLPDWLMDHYENPELLGQNALGHVWRGQDRITGRDHIIKLRSKTEQSIQSVMREQSLLDQVMSEHVQKRLNSWQHDDEIATAYAYIDGPSLEDHLKSIQCLSVHDTLDLARALLQGLSVIHGAGFIHRDISPSNIILPQGDCARAVLVDFNAIGELTESTLIGQTTVVGQFAGKPYYMAPEQFAGAPQSAKTDVWGLGAVLYEASVGSRYRQSSDIIGLAKEAMSSNRPDVGESPADLRDLLASFLANDPAARPTAEAALGKVMALKSASQSTPQTSEQRPPAPEPMGYAPQVPAPAKSSAGTWVLLALAIAVLTVSILASVFMFGFLGDISLPPLPALTDPDFTQTLMFIVLGLGLILCGLFATSRLRRRAQNLSSALPLRAAELIAAPDARARLSETICIEIDTVRQAAANAGEEFLTVTMVALAKEYADAETSEERFKALEMLNDLQIKIARRIQPWWLDYETLIARGISLTSLIAGAVALFEAYTRLAAP